MQANVLLHGTGALNIDACRVPSDEPIVTFDRVEGDRSREQYRTGTGENRRTVNNGRWPANVLHDGSEEVLQTFPNATGQKANLSADPDSGKHRNTYNAMRRGEPRAARGDVGSAARFFYCAKASRADRNDGLDDVDAGVIGDGRTVLADSPYQRGNLARRNTHPTVKPTELMRYLCRLVTPPGGTVLDPFMGSGSTGKAADLEGFHFVGIELDPDYIEIARRRIGAGAPLFAFAA